MFDNFVLKPIVESMIKFADRNAFFIDNKTYTYNDLAQNVSKIRQKLKQVQYKGVNIGLIANDDIETYASMIAIWMEGFSYVPIHPNHPIDRGNEIIEQAEIALMLDSSTTQLYSSTQTVLTSNLIFSTIDIDLISFDEHKIAYILFTSGSTGKPKGVPITRHNLGAFMKSFWKIGFNIDEHDRCLQCFDLTFDVSVQSFLSPLTKGACTYTIPHNQIKYSYASELLEDQNITFAAMAPSMVRFFRPYFDEIHLPDLRWNILTAEASPLNLINEWANCIPNAQIVNLYGPTEATIYCTYNYYQRGGMNKELNGMFSIGVPMDGVLAIICDEKGEILPKNQKGELCIAGDQITEGYWKNQEKNQSSFFTKEIDGVLNRFYKTGDNCYFDDADCLMLSGRLDYQVKIQGYRIELGEIECYAREAANGGNAVVVVFENKTGANELAMFIESEAAVDEGKIKDFLKSKVPTYMIPSRILVVPKFPLNTNGKTDRLVLKKLL